MCIAPLELISHRNAVGQILQSSPWPLLLSVGWEKGVCITPYGLCHCEDTRARFARW